MTRRRTAPPLSRAALAALLWLACAAAGGGGCRSRSTLPPTVADAEFWRLTTRLSEPAGTFTHSDNLVSNESAIIYIAPLLRPSGGVYIGVGPEQNFTYIAALRPAMAFIVDIRAENRSLHLLYKALFELSHDRADFIFRLFSRQMPAAARSGGSVETLFSLCTAAPPLRELRDETGRRVREHLLVTHKFALSNADLQWIDYALDAFYTDGPEIHYARSRPRDPAGPSYRSLMTTPDVFGEYGSYLSSDTKFTFLKRMQERNLIVPLVGDFAGPTTLRGVADYVREHGAVVTAFYGSNVDVYLNREKSARYCGNLASLPYTWQTFVIGARGRQMLRARLEACAGRVR